MDTDQIEGMDSTLADLAELIRAVNVLRESGQWDLDRSDLLSVIRRSRREIYHSRILAWLLDPQGSHRLGSTFLERFLTTLGIDGDGGATGIESSRVRTEVTRPESRADIVIWLPGRTVVIEMKVDADEGEEQCARLCRDWKRAREVTFVFLTPDGRRPRTRGDCPFRTLTFSEVWRLLDRTLTEAGGDGIHPGIFTARSYLETLQRSFRMEDSGFERLSTPVEFYLTHRDTIQELYRLKDREAQELKTFLRSVKEELDDRASTLPGRPRVHWVDHSRYPKVLFTSESWRSGNTVLVAIGVRCSTEVGFEHYWAGVWINSDKTPGMQLRDRVRQTLNEEELLHDPGAWKTTAWWAARHRREMPGGFWEDLPAWRSALMDEMARDWGRLHAGVNRAVRRWREEE